ncbi:hypothetical protein Tco_0555553 [Tanacetum coccineum]
MSLAFFTKNLAQPWQTMFKDFLHYVQQKNNVIQYPRLTKLIIVDLMEKFESIPKRLEEDYHTIKDDILLVNVYTIGEVTVRGMLITDDLLTDAIRDTHAYKDYVKKFERTRKRKGKQAAGESSSPKPSLKIRIKQQKPTSITPLPPSDDQERDDIIEATQLSLALDKITKVYEEQQNMATVEKKMLDEDVEKLVDGEEEYDGIDCVDTVILSDEDALDRLELGSHKENPEKNDDDKKKDDKKDDDDDNDDDDHALIRTRVTGSSEIRTEIVANNFKKERESSQAAVHALISQEFAAHAPKIIEELFRIPCRIPFLMAKFDKSSASAASCRNDAFRMRDHDEHKGDDAPPEGEKKCEKAKDVEKLRVLIDEDKEDLKRPKPDDLVFYGPKRNLNEPPRIVEIVKVTIDQQYGLDYMERLAIMRENDKPDSFSEADFKYLNKKDIEDMYY